MGASVRYDTNNGNRPNARSTRRGEGYGILRDLRKTSGFKTIVRRMRLALSVGIEAVHLVHFHMIRDGMWRLDLGISALVFI